MTAAKSDWLRAEKWLGFSPADNSLTARERCRAVVNRQANNGYILEYITSRYGEPNLGFESDPLYLADKSSHAPLAGRLVGVHRIRASARPLWEFIGTDRYEHLQDVWAKSGQRHRWAV